MLKRVFDIIFSFAGLIVTSLLLGLIAFGIKLDSQGPIFYRGERVGRRGRVFRMIKFRTMVQNADTLGGPSTAGDDPRLTKIGTFLKTYQLDELPQLINILKGEMSFVGPRPEVQYYVDMMEPEERDIILSVRPGLTDLASLWNFHEGEILRGSPNPEKTYQEKIRPTKLRLQKEYVKNHSLWLDGTIILKTIIKIFI